jgi:5-formyltetrahydrofolate cyclo-ligase
VDKEELRKRVRSIRLAMPAEEAAEKSRAIVNRVIAETDWRQVKAAHMYSTIEKLNEVDTGPLINYLKSQQPRIKIDIQSTASGSAIPTKQYDLIIVPVLAFDKKANRLGWGGGWYDRFLIAQPQALKVGLAYQPGFVAKGLPVEQHDIPLDKIITEEGIITS